MIALPDNVFAMYTIQKSIYTHEIRLKYFTRLVWFSFELTRKHSAKRSSSFLSGELNRFTISSGGFFVHTYINMAKQTNFVVTTDQGKIRGKSSIDYHGGTFYSFSGIPYAKAPIGELRFKAPQLAEPWEGVRDGTKEGWECPSLDMYFGYNIGNEDNCLNLNVHTKEFPTENGKKKPVMVWIHGGGFIYGCNRSAVYGPQYLMTEDIVLISINYRLGIFGFLSLEDPSLGVTGNAGLKDQVMALRWVQKYIHSFGGDPNNVTIFGESAGAASVHYLTVSPLSKGLFHKAIMQSGSAFNVWARGKRNVTEVAKCMGYKETDEKAVLEKLCKEGQKRIVKGLSKIKDVFNASEVRPVGPVIETPCEGAFLTEDPEDIIKAGKYHQVPIIIGFNSMEGMLYELLRKVNGGTPLMKNMVDDVPFDLKVPRNSLTSREIAEKIQKFYYKDQEISEANIDLRYQAVGDIQFLHGIQKAARLYKRYGHHPVYVYRMSLDSSLNFFKRVSQCQWFVTLMACQFLSKMSGDTYLKDIFQTLAGKLPMNSIPGAAHADDIFYLFSTFLSPKITAGSEEDLNIQKFVKIWTNFAKYGNPTPEPDVALNKLIWKPITNDNVDIICDINNEITLTGNLEKERINFLDTIYDKYAIVA